MWWVARSTTEVIDHPMLPGQSPLTFDKRVARKAYDLLPHG